jgi:hypothetical protein
MRGHWFVFLAACSFSPTQVANGTTPDSSGMVIGSDAGEEGSGSGTSPPADARNYGPGSDNGSDCSLGHGPLIRGGSGCCGPRCGR